MKTYHIKDLLKKDLLIVELPENTLLSVFPRLILICDRETNEYHHIKGSYIILGSPDEIKESDAIELAETLWNGFRNYSEDGSVGNYQRLVYKTALESFNSALESEIFWYVNPLGEKPKFEYDFPEDGPSDFMYESAVDDFDISSIKWNEAQEKTFDKKRVKIFVKN